MATILDNRANEVLALQAILTPYLVFDKYYKKDGPALMAIIGKVDSNLVVNWDAKLGRCFEIMASTPNWDKVKITQTGRFADRMDWVKFKSLPKSVYTESAEIDPEKYYLQTVKPNSSRQKVVGTSFYIMTSFNSSSVEDKQIVKLMDLDRLRGIMGPLPALLPLLEGISTPIFYMGLAGSCTGFHVEEGLLASVNLLMSGKSTWIFVDPAENHKLEDLIRRNEKKLKASKYKIQCKFPLAHKERYIPIWQLREHNIKYHIVNQQAGDVIFVYANVYHQVFNSTDCIKVAYASTSLQWYDLFSDPKEYCSKLRLCACGRTYNFRTRYISRLKLLMRMTNHSIEATRHMTDEHLQWARENASMQYEEQQKKPSQEEDLQSLKEGSISDEENHSQEGGLFTDDDDDNISVNDNGDDEEQKEDEDGDDNDDNLFIPIKVKEGKGHRKRKSSMSPQHARDDELEKKDEKKMRDRTTDTSVQAELSGATMNPNHIVESKEPPNESSSVLYESFPYHYKSKFKTCKYCKRRYRRSYIKAHYDNAHSYPCEQCHKVFRNNDLLSRHKKGTHGNEKFKCNNCMKVFTTTRARKVHVDTMHPPTPARAELWSTDRMLTD